MSWRRKGLYFSFNREAIHVCAPADSGVYVLYNLNDPVFVGESVNIQEALLSHEGDSTLRSGPHRPTGFTFEICSERKRKQKAAELIETLSPALQTKVTPSHTPPERVQLVVSEFPIAGFVDSSTAGNEDFSSHERDSHAITRRRFKSGRARAATLSAIFLLSIAASFYLGTITGAKLQNQPALEFEPSFTWAPIVSPAQQVSVDLDDKSLLAVEPMGEIAIQIPGWAPTPMEAAAATAKTDRSASGAPYNDWLAQIAVQDKLQEAAKNSPALQLAGGVETSKKWSVQIYAAPAKEIADALAERLIMAGYDSYVMQAHIKGHTYFRVRVGNLDDQQEAESLRQVLSRDEGYRDAFLARD